MGQLWWAELLAGTEVQHQPQHPERELWERGSAVPALCSPYGSQPVSAEHGIAVNTQWICQNFPTSEGCIVKINQFVFDFLTWRSLNNSFTHKPTITQLGRFL